MVFGLFKSKKQKKEDLRIKKLKEQANTKGGGRSGSKRRQDAIRELERPAKEKALKEKKEKQKATRERVKEQNRIRNSRRGSGARNRSDSTSKSTDTKGKSTVSSTARAANVARHGEKAISRLEAKTKDFQKMKKGALSKVDFIKKYPNSQTAKKAKSRR